jgi:hypothetical protein
VVPCEECQFEAIRDATLGEKIAHIILDDLLLGPEATSNFPIFARHGNQAGDLQFPSSEAIADANTNQV